MDDIDSLPWKSLKSSFPVIAKDERLLRSSHSHWMKYVTTAGMFLIFVCVSVTLFLLALSVRNDSPQVAEGMLYATLLVSTIASHWFFHYVLSESVSDVVLTTRRVFLMKRSLWFLDTVDDIALAKIKMVEVNKQGLLRRLFNYGDLWLDTGNKIVRYLPAPKAWAERIERGMGR